MKVEGMSQKFGDYEYHNPLELESQEFHRYASDQYVTGPNGITMAVCSPRGLAVLKRSHLHRDLKFDNHIRQYQLLDRDFDEKDLDLLANRTTLTKAAFGDRVPSLAMSNDAFFDDNVKKVFVHDDIHAIIAHYDEPLYMKMQRDPTRAWCERDMWEDFSLQEKTECVQEEAYVIAIERYIVPQLMNERRYPHRMAFDKALSRICTTLCSGFFRDHAIDHWSEAIQFKQSQFDKFFNSKLWHDSGIPQNVA